MFVLFLMLEGQYSLTKGDGSKKYSYICETAKSEAFRIIQDDRDFSKINFNLNYLLIVSFIRSFDCCHILPLSTLILV